ncbi:MAG: DedA family protein [Planctomycetes bacterium]|nr:DedA family protein [Planctomycetota bacterium]
MMHEFLSWWFHLVDQWGYFGVFLLMAMESSIIPVPSEIVMPPAAFWAAQGRMSFWGVVAAGTFGSYFGSAVSYWAAQWLGVPLIRKFGKYVLISEKNFQLAEAWVTDFGLPGVFVARLLPVVRHLISIPAGIFKMSFWKFSVVTIAGAGIWCAVLAWFGQEIIGKRPELLNSPEDMIHVIKDQLKWFVAAVALIGVLYLLVVIFKKKRVKAPANL